MLGEGVRVNENRDGRPQMVWPDPSHQKLFHCSRGTGSSSRLENQPSSGEIRWFQTLQHAQECCSALKLPVDKKLVPVWEAAPTFPVAKIICCPLAVLKHLDKSLGAEEQPEP